MRNRARSLNWVYLLGQTVSVTRRGDRRVFQERFPLKTMLSFIRQVIGRHVPLTWAVYLHYTDISFRSTESGCFHGRQNADPTGS